MGKRAVAVLCAMTFVVAVSASTPVAARVFDEPVGIDEITSLDFTNFSYSAALFSSDLSTAARLEFDFGTGTPGPLVVVDIQADTRRVLDTPRSFADRVELVGIDGDGSTLLIGADWQGLEAGDDDAGLIDAFLVDTSTGAATSLTDSLGEVSVVPLSIDRAGDTVVLSVYRPNQEPALYLWDEGVLTELTLPSQPFADFQLVGPTTLAADGESLLYSSQLGFQTRWHLRDLDSGTEQVIAAIGYQAVVSFDGSAVVSVSRTGDSTSSLRIWDTAGTSVRSFDLSLGVSSVILSDDASVAMVSGVVITDDRGYEEYSGRLARVDLNSGQLTKVGGTTGFGDLSLRAADLEGDRAIVQTAFSLLPERPVTVEDLYGGAYEEAVYLLDFDGTTAVPPALGYVGSLDDQMARLYEAYFDRAPDAGGLEFWREQRANGRSLDSVSDEFARSPEFVDTYGSLDDDAFVGLVYRNVLDRAPDAGGRAFWIDQLSNGRSRGSLMTLFSESPEFIDATGTIAAPLPTEAALGRLYAALLGRAPDAAGLAGWTAEINRGVPFDDVVWFIMQSAEFQSLYGDVLFDPYALVEIIHVNAIEGIVDDAGFAAADSFYSEGRPIEEILAELLNSPRFVAATSSTPPAG